VPVRAKRPESGLAVRLLAVPSVLIWGEAVTAHNLLRGVKRRAESSEQTWW
jgi:hypothetical protein